MSQERIVFADYVREIYLAGVSGDPAPHPMVWTEWERLAYERITPIARDFVEGGAGTGATMRANREAFDRWRIVPRMLRDFSRRTLEREVLGMTLPAPVMLSPIGAQSLMVEGAELASARAAAELGIAFSASTPSSYPLEEIAAAAGAGPKLFQLYWPRDDRELALSLVGRAQAAGYGAILVTVDTGGPAWRPADLARAHLPFLHGFGIANFAADPVFRSRLARPPEEDPSGAIDGFVKAFMNPALTWEEVEWMRDEISLPIVLKGIQHPDDARRAAEIGVAGIGVSNHGGRQVDGAIGSLDALPGIVDAVDGRIEVLFDSGIRSGTDIFKALALGASAVLVGRPYLWGLAADGEAGVRAVLRSLLAELDATMGLCGITSVDGIDRGALVPAP